MLSWLCLIVGFTICASSHGKVEAIVLFLNEHGVKPTYSTSFWREGAMKYISSLDREHRLWVWLHHALHTLYRAREKELAQFDIPLMQAGVLFVIENLPEPKTPARISRQLLRERHSVHTLLNRMEQQCLLYKTRDSHNKRLSWVVYSPLCPFKNSSN